MRAHGAAAITTLILFTAVTGCSDARERPESGSTGPSGPISLSVEVVNPQINEIFYAGAVETVTVRGSEASGKLIGVGYVIRRNGPDRQLLDSTAVMFEPTSDTVFQPFHVTIPDTMPHNSQLNVFGVAFGPGDTSAQSEPETVIISECPDNAGFC